MVEIIHTIRPTGSLKNPLIWEEMRLHVIVFISPISSLILIRVNLLMWEEDRGKIMNFGLQSHRESKVKVDIQFSHRNLP